MSASGRKELFQDGMKRCVHGERAGVPDRSRVSVGRGRGTHLGFMEKKREALLSSGLARVVLGGFQKSLGQDPNESLLHTHRRAKITNSDNAEYW